MFYNNIKTRTNRITQKRRIKALHAKPKRCQRGTQLIKNKTTREAKQQSTLAKELKQQSTNPFRKGRKVVS